MKLVFVSHRSGAAFEVADVAAFLGNDQRAFKLTRVGCINAEIGRQLHWATHAFRDVDERSVTEDGPVQCREVVVTTGHNGAKVFLNQFRMLDDGFRERTEDDAGFRQLFLERRCD